VRKVPIAARGRLDEDPFSHRTTKSGQVLVSRGGRQIAIVAGEKGRRLLARLAGVGSEEERQLLLAKATGNYRHGNERPG
jgi:hypothetical protein